MKYIIGLIIGLILTAFIAYGDSLTYTIAEIQVLLDDIYNRISTSSGASDSGKVIETNASGKVDATFLTSVAGIATVQEGDVSVGGSDIVTMDFDAGVFAITEAPDTEVNVDIQDDGGLPQINKKHLAPLRFPLIDKIKQKAIVDYLEGLRNKAEQLAKRQAETESELEQFMPALLAKAFRGEL